MTNAVLSARDVRALLPAITTPAARKRAAVVLRRVWRTYWDRQTRRATAVMLYALSDRTLADIGIDRSEIESLVSDTTLDRMRRFVWFRI
jgi:uncharacterized protein YjiS (DUF1127 family)